MAGVRMQKSDSLALRAGNRAGMEEAETALLEVCQRGLDVIHRETDVVHPSAAPQQGGASQKRRASSRIGSPGGVFFLSRRS